MFPRNLGAGAPKDPRPLANDPSCVGAEGLEPRPSPCKGEAKVLVGGLSSAFVCHRSALVYLGVLPSCYARCYAIPGQENAPRVPIETQAQSRTRVESRVDLPMHPAVH
jgi:hypothetical protein